MTTSNAFVSRLLGMRLMATVFAVLCADIALAAQFCLAVCYANGEGVDRDAANAESWCRKAAEQGYPRKMEEYKERLLKEGSVLSWLTLPNGVTKIANGVLSNYSSLTSVTIPSSVKSIEDYAFFGCSDLIEAKVPEKCKIEAMAFPEGCKIIRY